MYLYMTELSSTSYLYIFFYSFSLLLKHMENLYNSLYDDIIHNEDNPDVNSELTVFESISVGYDINSLSEYCSFEKYTTITIPFENNFTNILHVNIRSLQKTLTC